jgi:hypothetical protein
MAKMSIKKNPSKSRSPELGKRKWAELIRLAETEMECSLSIRRRKQLVGASKRFLAALGYDRAIHIDELRKLDESLKALRGIIEGLSFWTADLVDADESDEEPGPLDLIRQALSRLHPEVKRDLELLGIGKTGPKPNSALNSYVVILYLIYFHAKGKRPVGKRPRESKVKNFFSFVRACLNFQHENFKKDARLKYTDGSIEKAIRKAREQLKFLYQP